MDGALDRKNLPNFYSRPCGRGDTRTDTALSVSCSFLLTPLREGRQAIVVSRALATTISTHAPAGGATSIRRKHESLQRISTHAPAGGATMPNWSLISPRIFLLTPLREGRPDRVESNCRSQN